jgi:hypothetical protein
MLHSSPEGQVPHEPPQPLEPQTIPVQDGLHWQTPRALQDSCDPEQVPHDPPQPSGPQSFPSHCGAHWQ